MSNFRTFSFFLFDYQTRLTGLTARRARLPGIDMDKMITAEVEVLLRLLAELEREELELMMQERHEAERSGRLH